MRRKLIAGNWKMNNDLSESLKLVEELKSMSDKFDKDVDVLICPTFVNLYPIKQSLIKCNIKVGAQNMHFENKGAFTGEIAPSMLKNIGIDYVIIGHSERRQFFNELDETVNKKLKAAHINGIIPIICVGETLEQRESGIEKETVKNQILKAFDAVDSSEAVNTVIAYEPIWAIGTGRTASSEQANEMASFIRGCILEIYNNNVSDKIIIQYGGSVKANNAKEILTQSDIDGALIGGASLNAEEFFKIINYAK